MRRSLVAVTLLVAAWPVGAAAAPVWTTAAPFGAAAQLDSLRVDFGGGDVVAVWSRWNGSEDVVQALVLHAGEAAEPVVDLSPADTSGESPTVALDGRGGAIVVWQHVLGGGTRVIVARRLSPAGTWGPRVRVSPRGRDARDPEIAVDARGNAIVGWLGTDGTNDRAQAAFRRAGGTWGKAKRLSAPGQEARSVRVGIDDRGHATVLWTRFNGAFPIAQAARRSASGAWSKPRRLSAPGREAEEPALAVAGNGVVVAVWHRLVGGDFVVQAVRRSRAGQWSRPTPISTAGETAENAAVALGRSGGGVAAWERRLPSGASVIEAAPLVGATWQAPEELSDTTMDADSHDVEVAANAAGKAVALWSRTTGGDLFVQAAVRPAAGSWGDADTLSSSGGDGILPQPSVDGAGNAVAMWFHQVGSDSTVRLAGYDAAGPMLAGALPRRATVGRPTTFAVTPTDVWGVPVGEPSWLFGDGGSDTGASVSHVYGARGSFTVEVSQADSHGNSTTRRHTIRVGPPCRVPRVVGRRLAGAKRALVDAGCRPGEIRRVRSSAEPGRVVAQRPRPGRTLPFTTPVRLTVSRGG